MKFCIVLFFYSIYFMCWPYLFKDFISWVRYTEYIYFCYWLKLLTHGLKGVFVSTKRKPARAFALRRPISVDSVCISRVSSWLPWVRWPAVFIVRNALCRERRPPRRPDFIVEKHVGRIHRGRSTPNASAERSAAAHRARIRIMSNKKENVSGVHRLCKRSILGVK